MVRPDFSDAPLIRIDQLVERLRIDQSLLDQQLLERYYALGRLGQRSIMMIVFVVMVVSVVSLAHRLRPFLAAARD